MLLQDGASQPLFYCFAPLFEGSDAVCKRLVCRLYFDFARDPQFALAD